MEAHKFRIVVRGLENVVAAETRISSVDPNGRLYYSGYNIDDLAKHVSYEEVVHLLWYNKLPNEKELSSLRSELISEMKLPVQINRGLEDMSLFSLSSHPMDVLCTAVPYLGLCDPDRTDNSQLSNMRKSLRLVAKVPTIVANFHRIRSHKPLIPPNKELGFAANFLYMFSGKVPDEEEKEAIDRYMVLHADHGLNASTFSARVTASTRSDMYSAITTAIGTLKGPLHGGASERVMAMLYDINHVEEVEAYIEGMLYDRKRVMGFGHRVYKAEDPRARHLREMSEKLCRRINQDRLHKKSRKIEDVVRKKKGIFPNVDFYAATVMHALGVPSEYFPAFFASSRVSGWTAHVIEQYNDNRLIRPTSKYIGLYGRPFTPIEDRL